MLFCFCGFLEKQILKKYSEIEVFSFDAHILYLLTILRCFEFLKGDCLFYWRRKKSRFRCAICLINAQPLLSKDNLGA